MCETQARRFLAKINIIPISKNGALLPETKINCLNWFKCLPNWGKKAIQDLVEQQLWNEVNNSFLKNLEFGSGGMQSCTIAETITSGEYGKGAFRSSGTCYYWKCFSQRVQYRTGDNCPLRLLSGTSGIIFIFFYVFFKFVSKLYKFISKFVLSKKMLKSSSFSQNSWAVT